MAARHVPEILVLHAESRIHVTTVHIGWNEQCEGLKQAVAWQLGVHMCKFDLSVGEGRTESMRNGLTLRRYAARMVPPNSVKLVFRELGNASCAEMFRQGICYKCMRDFEVQVKDIFQWLIQNRRAVCASLATLREAGYTLLEMVDARSHFIHHPPVSWSTLFNVQLHEAGFTASDFRLAGFTAKSLYRDARHWDDPEITPGEAEWEETEVFFTFEELREAGFPESEIHQLQLSQAGE